MAGDEYHNCVRLINDLEKRIDSGEAVHEPLRNAYDKLLTEFPVLEGFWIRRAHTEFRLENSVDAAIKVFETALHTLNLNYSLVLWTAYLKFLARVCVTTASSREELRGKFETASQLVGNHFLSHEFWDLYLEIHERPVSLLVHILDSLTIHQFAKYYASLVSKLATHDSIAEFRNVLPAELQSVEISAEELPQIKEVLASRLKLKYELHARRVKQAMAFERNIRRPFFYPSVALRDTANWVQYAQQADDPLAIYRRALIPGVNDAQMWLAYIRYHHLKGLTASEIEAAYRVPTDLKIVPVMLHYALWLELNGHGESALAVYAAAEAVRDNHYVSVIVQFSQFLVRRSDLEQALQKVRHALQLHPHNSELERELNLVQQQKEGTPSKPEPIRVPTVDEIIAEFA